MRALRLTDPALLAAGTFSNTRLDPFAGTLAAQGTPAIVADVDVMTGVMSFPNAVGTLSGTWGQTTSMLLFPIPIGGSTGPVATSAVNSAWTLTTSAYAVDIAYSQTAVGAIGHVTVDGQPRLAFDSSNPQTSIYRLYLDGQSHIVAVTYTGDAVLGTSLIGAPVDVSGTAGLAAALTATRNGAAVVGDTWSATATSTTSVTIRNGASVVQGVLTAGQTSDTLIAGVALTLRAGAWDATSVAHITTIAPTLTLTGITTYANLAAVSSYTSPVFDSGVSNTSWPLLEMTEGPVGSLTPTITMGVGDTPIPDGTWTWQTVVPVTTPDVFGNPWFRAVWPGPSQRGRYAQAIGGLSNQSRVVLSDIRLYFWQPETDLFLGILARSAYRGPNSQTMLTALAAVTAYQDELSDELLGAAAISTSSGVYLSQYGALLTLPRLAGEPDANYRSRLASRFSGKNQGGSRSFLQSVISGALGCPVVVAPRSRSIGGFALSTTALGTSGLGRSTTGAWRWSVQVPLAQLQVPPETATAIIGQLRPTGSIVNVIYT
jgi:hypothetical protein